MHCECAVEEAGQMYDFISGKLNCLCKPSLTGTERRKKPNPRGGRKRKTANSSLYMASYSKRRGLNVFCIFVNIILHLWNVHAQSDMQIPLSKFHGVRRSDFPSNFLFGVASSAYQYEGGYNKDGKGLSNWDVFSHIPGNIVDGTTGDVAVDEYHRFKEDVQTMSELGVNSYRFSIAWSRIFPDGRGKINPEGVKYYNSLIDLLIEKEIEPLVTLCHYDIPQGLQDLYGGFLGDQFADDFGRYAETCFRIFGSRVKMWITFNEANIFIVNGFGNGKYPPARCSGKCKEGNSSIEPYVATHNVLRAHATAVRLYRTQFQKEQQGLVGMVLSGMWGKPLSSDPKDVAAARRFMDFELAWYLHPLVYGRYPKSMRKLLGKRLPKLSRDLKDQICGTLDFIGVNFYGALYVSDANPKTPSSSFQQDMKVFTSGEKNGVLIGSQMTPLSMYGVPSAIREILRFLKNRYSDPHIIITENGFGDRRDDSLSPSQILSDTSRVDYLAETLHHLSISIKEDEARVKGYYLWSLLDNFEWAFGYTSKFGLYHVNFSSPSLSRIPKLSAHWYAHFLDGDTAKVLDL